MISTREKGFFQLLLLFQVALMTLAFWGCFVVMVWGLSPQGVTFEWFEAYIKYWLSVMVAMTLEAAWRSSALRPAPGRMRWVAAAVSRRQWIWVIGSLALLLVFSQDLRISRLFLAVFSGVSLVVLYVSNRYLTRGFGDLSSRYLNRWKLRTVILGPELWCKSVLPEIKTIHSMLDVARIEHTDGREHDCTEYSSMLAQQPVDLLIMPPRHFPDVTVVHLLREGDKLGFRCWLPVELTGTYGRRFELQKVGLLDVLTPPVEPLENLFNQTIKRAFDVVFSLAVIVTILPLLCLIVLCIHAKNSPGPLFFKQKRVGKNGVGFQVLKFRTLHVNNGDEAQQVTLGDARLFKGSKLLRKTSIDEMPQFLNVLMGTMSVVGPRPHMEEHDYKFRELFERYGVRRYVKPGLTGLAQVKGYRGEVNCPQDLRNRARLDNFYVTHWGLSMDLGIVAKTGISVIRPPKSAY